MCTLRTVDATAVTSARAIQRAAAISRIPPARRTRMLRRQTRVALHPAPSTNVRPSVEQCLNINPILCAESSFRAENHLRG